MGRRSAGRRPSAHDQQTRARGLAVLAVVLGVALLAGMAALVGLVTNPLGQGTPGRQGLPGLPVLQDADAPQEPEPPAEPQTQPLPDDGRAAELALDPSRQTDWLYSGTGEKTVYLTFDDGPSENTRRVLDVLDRYGVKATFFVTGHGAEHRGLIREAYDRGHSIGLHTMTHDYANVYSSEDAFFRDLEQVGQVVQEQIGFVPYLTRFPGGASNTVSANYCPGIMSSLVNSLTARGYQYYDWNVSSADASGNNVDVQRIVDSSCAEGYTNVMLLFHDSNTKGTTVDALPQIIEFYQERGYTFAAIDRNAFVCHHGVNN